MRSFQKVFSKIYIFEDIAPTIWVFLGFSKNVSDEHTYHFCIKSSSPPPPSETLAFTPGKSLRRKDNNYTYLQNKRLRVRCAPPPTNNFRKTKVTPTNYISSEREFIGESESSKILGKYFGFAIL